MNKRFLIASGGTGGHFYPGFAIGKALRKHGCAVLFIVRKNDPAAQILEAHHLHYREIDFTGLPRSMNPLRHLRFTGKFFKSLNQTRRIVREFRQDMALGMAGYISFPLIFTAHLMGIKTAVHDSNACLGLANRICGKFADLFMLGLPLITPRKGTVLTGTPIRQEFEEPADRQKLLSGLGLDPALQTVLVVGGSQGAKNLNVAVAHLAKTNTRCQFIHITGERWYTTVREMHEGNPRVAVLPYSHEIYALMKSVDTVICRSGASTLAEVIYCQLPALLVPFPHAAGNHQYYNAKILADAGCATLVEDNDQLQGKLTTAFETMSKGQKLAAMRLGYKHLNLPSPLTAAKQIARLLTNFPD